MSPEIDRIVEKYIPEKHHNERRKLRQELLRLVNDAENGMGNGLLHVHHSRPMWRRVYNAILNRF